MIIDSLRRQMKNSDFEIIEPEVNFEIALYTKKMADDVRAILFQHECDISEEIEDEDIDLITFIGSCPSSCSLGLDDILKKKTSGNAFLSFI